MLIFEIIIIMTKKLKKSKKMSKDKFKNTILNDYRLIREVRESSAQGRRDVLSGKGSFGIFGDGKELCSNCTYQKYLKMEILEPDIIEIRHL